MWRSLALVSMLTVVAAPSWAQQGRHPYMGGPVELTTAPNGAKINSYALKRMAKVHPTTPQVIRVADGVWQLVGMSIVYPCVIEGTDGLIVYDTGDNLEEGRHFLKEIRKLSDKPVKAIIYSHAHYVHGASAVADGNKDVIVIGHPSLNKNLAEGGGLGTAFPELAPLQLARAAEQFNNFVPRKGPDAPVSGIIEIKESGFLPVTRPVANGEVITVAGVELQFYTEYHSDTDDCLTVWLPQRKIALNNLLWPFMPNFYTPRGSLYRDPFNWIEGLEFIRSLQPRILVSTHTVPIEGEDEVKRNVNLYRDGIAFIIDQTLRGALKGLGPDELRHFVKLPPHLEAFPLFAEGYGELQWYPPYFFNHALGWWDGDAANLYRIHPDDEAKRLVALMGGRDKVLAAARQAFDNDEFAWAAQLTTYLQRLNASDEQVRRLKADALRQIGYRARGPIMRSYALSQARELEGKVKIPRVIPPKVADVAKAKPELYLNHFRVRIDPKKSAAEDILIAFRFSDADDKELALHLRRGIVEFIENVPAYGQKPVVMLTLDREAWGQIFTGARDVEQLIESGRVKVKGPAERAVKFFSMFDRFEPYRGPLAVGEGVEDTLSQ